MTLTRAFGSFEPNVQASAVLLLFVEENVAGLSSSLDHQATFCGEVAGDAVGVVRDMPGPYLMRQGESARASSTTKRPVFFQYRSPDGFFTVQTIKNCSSGRDAGVRKQSDAVIRFCHHDCFGEAGFHGLDVGGALRLGRLGKHE